MQDGETWLPLIGVGFSYSLDCVACMCEVACPNVKVPSTKPTN